MKSAPRISSTCAALLAVLTAAFISAGTAAAADGDVVTSMTSGRIERIMKSFTDVKNFKELDNNLCSFETAALKVVLHNGGETMVIVATFQGRATLTRLNEWNQTRRFTRAYLDKEGNVCLDHVLELNGGVTEKNVKEWMGTFVACLKEFKKYMEE